MKETLKILGIILVIIIFAVSVIVGLVLLVRVIPKQPQTPALTNEQVIEQTVACESNGLKARQIYKAGSYKIKQIICEPNNEKETQGETKIKKSNITNVEVNIPPK